MDEGLVKLGCTGEFEGNVLRVFFTGVKRMWICLASCSV